jgi:hypothetical protein
MGFSGCMFGFTGDRTSARSRHRFPAAVTTAVDAGNNRLQIFEL